MRPIERISICVGLWLAEGDNKTIAEITFTNNNIKLIRFFYSTLREIFPQGKFRLYVYSKNEYQNKNPIKVKFVNYYIDRRARIPYFIIRLMNRKAVIKWKKIVEKITKNKNNYKHILKGFFAGEGNIKEGSHHSRQIRIAQGKRNILIEKILDYLEIKHSFSERERAYRISGRKNWEKFYKLKLYDLHPDKRKRFLRVYREFKEWHYSHNFIKNNILPILTEPITSNEMAKYFNRSQARIRDILLELKNENKIITFRVRSTNYWVKSDRNIIVISKRKQKILRFLNKPQRTSDIAKEMDINWKAANKRLKELEKLGLVKNESNMWNRIYLDKEVKAL